ncbi:hypothetical protein K505DRAFT_374813 [Melanomma pulvis-pyrius CBS 109.77]|uniref:Uncharacterized protein n=1 Tax=Melanomma pulvis-pyrius CBS 109.77 TaxID=1314802 RepID=A0A6A6XD14_9PLEO|nr:hypothetical protein K505DRAFT_374813 [Melanomma pulvis-pyrius CBS 109.77]
MPTHQKPHHGKVAYTPRDVRKSRDSSRTSSSVGSSRKSWPVDSYVPYYPPRPRAQEFKHRQSMENKRRSRWSDAVDVAESDKEEGEWSSREELSTRSSSSGGSMSVSTTQRSRSSSIEIDDYIDSLYENVHSQDRLSKVMDKPRVIADIHRREYHWGKASARQFNMELPYVMDMLRYMYERYDTVSCYSLGMLEEGAIIYYLEPFVIGLDQAHGGRGTAKVGGRDCTARVHLKGRFGIVLGTYGQHVKVLESATFKGQGLGKVKHQRLWHEYVGIHATGGYTSNPSPNKALEIGFSCCALDPESSIHLAPSKISLSNQILIAGNITSDSLARLRTMVKRMWYL